MSRLISYHDREVQVSRWLLVWILAAVVAVAWGFVIGYVSKSLWEWLGLLVVPVALAIVGFLFSVNERKSDRQAADKRATTEQKIATNRAQDAILQTYFDRMSDLLLNHRLRDAAPERGEVAGILVAPEVAIVARARTLAAIRELDGSRKGALVRFLHEAGLIDWGTAVVDLREALLVDTDLCRASLRGADFSDAILHGADLSEANLNHANLSRAKLTQVAFVGATLHKAKLTGADLREADMYGAQLINADLSKAILIGASLIGADLIGATLSGATLTGADLREANLFEVDLSNTTLRGADMDEADLLGCRNLTQEQLDSTMSYKGAKNLPAGLQPDTRPPSLS